MQFQTKHGCFCKAFLWVLFCDEMIIPMVLFTVRNWMISSVNIVLPCSSSETELEQLVT